MSSQVTMANVMPVIKKKRAIVEALFVIFCALSMGLNLPPSFSKRKSVSYLPRISAWIAVLISKGVDVGGRRRRR